MPDNREFRVFGECMVGVGGNPTHINPAAQLGITSKPVDISIKFIDKPIHTDEYGTEAVADWVSYPSEAIIKTRLAHWDEQVLGTILDMAGGKTGDETIPDVPFLGRIGTGRLPGTGRLTSRNVPASNQVPGQNTLTNYMIYPCNFITLYLVKSPVGGLPVILDYIFPTCKLVYSQETSIGTNASEVELVWHAIAYAGHNSSNEVVATNAQLYVQGQIADYLLDILYGTNADVMRKLGLI
jgi:hypothetical protein